CGRTCGPGCAAGERCDEEAGRCEVVCVPACGQRVCGDDGCGGSCGTCPANSSCSAAGDGCVCVGPGCGLACCAAGDVCAAQGCCSPACGGRTCGDDGCGGSCGACPQGSACAPAGDDCLCPGPWCGEGCCAGGETCWLGACCPPDCAGKQCGDDGCGGSCGGCSAGEICQDGACACLFEGCGEGCCGAGEVCWQASCCLPDCADRACGDDGCGAVCGACPAGELCDEATSTCAPGDPGLTWVAFAGDSFLMGSPEGQGSPYQEPQHQVWLAPFELTLTEVSVAQYRRCYLAGGCSRPGLDEGSNWGVAGRQEHPVNAIDWSQAGAYCRWAGGRLPSESEWEYAARSGGRDQRFPWGNEGLSCVVAVYDDWLGGATHPGCGLGGTDAICSRPNGRSAQGLCDLLGNAWEWVGDSWHDSYLGAPVDGSAWDDLVEPESVMRGGGYQSGDTALDARYRGYQDRLEQQPWTGVRCAR
ncbi:MAG TPA: SUMF1/EgtB/PvdO family nonheme iron enzyme, partial [Myxococcota bacterium]|nr:SUMF1/EgtB/PvdO family nonheme iron enzyme [Myxococcota bacterium]